MIHIALAFLLRPATTAQARMAFKIPIAVLRILAILSFIASAVASNNTTDYPE